MIPKIPHRQVELCNILNWVTNVSLPEATEGASLTLYVAGAPCGVRYEGRVAKEMNAFLAWFNENLAEHFQELKCTEVEYDGYHCNFAVKIVCQVKGDWTWQGAGSPPQRVEA